MKKLCIYHGNCADGFGSAWVVRKALGDDVEFYAGVHQEPPPDVSGRDVIIVDFSYKKDVLIEMSKTAISMLIIDHHKTAVEDISSIMEKWLVTDMSNWTGKVDWTRYEQNLYQDYCENRGASGFCGIYTLFDMNRSGAGLTWDFFFPDKSRPDLIYHIEDRDLWKFNINGTREIQSAVFSYPYDFKVWDELAETCDELKGWDRMFTEGSAIERKHRKDIEELTQVVTRTMIIGGHTVPMANLPYTMASDAGHLLCGDKHPFAGCYWDTPNGRVFSLRSREDGADVGDIAKQYGGGGHKHASGFRVPFDQLGQFEVKQE